jgi:hypothetical protein
MVTVFSIFKCNRQLKKTQHFKMSYFYMKSELRRTSKKRKLSISSFFSLFFFYIHDIKNLTIKVLCKQLSCFCTLTISSFILLQFCMNNYLKNRLVFWILNEIRVLHESLIYIFIVLHCYMNHWFTFLLFCTVNNFSRTNLSKFKYLLKIISLYI